MRPTFHFPDVVPTLIECGVCLRALTEEDIPAWFARATDVVSADLAGDSIPASIEAGIAWLEGHRERFRRKTAIRWAIARKGSAESVGTIGLTIASEKMRTAELGVVVGRSYWGEGIGTSAAHVVTRYAFNTLGLAGIQAEVLQRNVASVRLLEKVGFRLLRALPTDPQSDGASEDCFLYFLSPQNDNVT